MDLLLTFIGAFCGGTLGGVVGTRLAHAYYARRADNEIDETEFYDE